MNTLTKILCEVNCKYGAPMGRRGNRPEPTTGKNGLQYTHLGRIIDRPVRLCEGYDKGGAYWGSPDNLRVRFNKSLTYIKFYRL